MEGIIATDRLNRPSAVPPREDLDDLRRVLSQAYARIRRTRDTADMRLVQSIERRIREVVREEASLATHTRLGSWPCAHVSEPRRRRPRPLFMVCQELSMVTGRAEPPCDGCPLRSVCRPPWIL